MNEALKRKIAAYMLNPRIRQSGVAQGGRMVFAEDAQMRDLIAEFAPNVTQEEMVEAYHWYLDEIAGVIDAARPNQPALKGTRHDVKQPAVTQYLRSGPKVTDATPGLQPFIEDLKNRDIAAIRAALMAHVAAPGMTTAESVSIREAEAVYEPVGTFEFAKRDLSTADTTIKHATNGVFRSGEALIAKLGAAEREIERLKRERPRAEAAETGKYRTVTRTAREVFKDALAEEIGPQDLNFDVTVFEWNVRHPRVPAIDPDYAFMPKDLYEILWCIESGKNAVLVGPPGCGKTVATAQLAARLGRPYYRVPLDGEMRKREILGGFKQVVENGVGVTKWYDGLVVQALQWPSILAMDEIDRGDPDLQYIAHQVYEGNGITILEDEGRFIAPHPHFALLGTANTKGRAEGMNIYNLSAEMSEATRDRFPFWIDWDYMPEAAERAQLLKKVPKLAPDTAEKIVQIARSLRACLVDGKIRTATSFRQVHTCGDYAAFLQKTLGDVVEARVRAIAKIIAARATDEGERLAIVEIIKKALGNEWETRMNPRAPSAGQP